MKAMIKCGLAAIMVVATAMPAMARSWDVCLVPPTDLNGSNEGVAGLPFFFAELNNIYPKGTFHQSTKASPLLSCATDVTPVGTFFSKGGLAANLPTAAAKSLKDRFFVDWLFRIDGKGQFLTSGATPSGDPGVTYPQIFTGSTGDLAPATGKATVLILSKPGDTNGDGVDAFRITTP